MNTDNPNPEVPPEKPHPQPEGGYISGANASKDARTMAMLAHLLGGLFCILGSLIIWLIKKDDDPFIDQEGKEATNFQITLLIAQVIGIVLVVISCGVLIFIPFVIWVIGLIFGIMAGLKANNGEAYRYPITLRLVK